MRVSGNGDSFGTFLSFSLRSSLCVVIIISVVLIGIREKHQSVVGILQHSYAALFIPILHGRMYVFHG